MNLGKCIILTTNPGCQGLASPRCGTELLLGRSCQATDYIFQSPYTDLCRTLLLIFGQLNMSRSDMCQSQAKEYK